MGARPTGRTPTAASLSLDGAWAGVRGRARAHDGRGSRRTAPGPTPERVIGALFVLAVLVLAMTRLLPAAVRASRKPGADIDRPARLLATATRALPPEHRDWGTAMRAELEHVDACRARWRFSLGCAWATGLICTRLTLTARERGRMSVRAVLAGGAAAVALAAYGLTHYPQPLSGNDTWAAVAGFPTLLLVYALTTLTLSRDATRPATHARRYGVAAGVATGSAWFLLLSPPGPLKQCALAFVAIALLGPACAAALAARSARHVTAGTSAALWSGIVGGLVAFAAWMIAAYARDGRPYDAGLLRDFHHSGSSHLTTYAVRNAFDTGLILLALIPVVALAFGPLGARLSRATRTHIPARTTPVNPSANANRARPPRPGSQAPISAISRRRSR